MISKRIYFAQRSDGQIKIGIATDVGQRMRDLATGAGQLKVLAVQLGDHGTEAELHRRFDELRADGEWFFPGRSLMAYIAAMTTGGVPAGGVARPSDALTPRQVASTLQVHVATVYRMMDAGTLPYWSPTPRKRFVSSAVLEQLLAGGAAAAEQETAA